MSEAQAPQYVSGESDMDRGRKLNPADEDHTREFSPSNGGQRESRGRKARDEQEDHMREFSPKGEVSKHGKQNRYDRRHNENQHGGHVDQGRYNNGGEWQSYQRGRGGSRGRGQNSNWQENRGGHQRGWGHGQYGPGNYGGGYHNRGGYHDGGRYPVGGEHQYDQRRQYDQQRQYNRGGQHRQDRQRDTGDSYNDEGRQESYGRKRDEDPVVFLSKKLSFILRHGAEKMGFKFMPGGFLWVDDILRRNEYQRFTVEDVKYVVATNDKKRFTLEEENGHLKIRANQGHSVEVEGLELTPITNAKEAPDVIHGTYFSSWEIIKEQGLHKMNRNHIHFAAGEPGENGVISGMRSSCEVIIKINMEKALESGLKFFRSANNVILCSGDENGFIRPCHFETVLNRRTRQSLLFNDQIKDGPKIPGLSGEMEKKKKKKKKNKQQRGENEDNENQGEDKKKEKKNNQGDRESNMEAATALFSEENEMEEEDSLPQNADAVPEDWDKDTTDQSDGAVNESSSEPQDFKVVNNRYDCNIDMEDLKSKEPVFVYCHMVEGKIESVSCVTKSGAFNFTEQLLTDGEFRDFLNTKCPEVKIFHNIADASKALFDQYSIILDGTDVYDNEVAFKFIKDKGLGNVNDLPPGFDHKDWGNLDPGPQLLEKCLVSLKAYDALSSWTSSEKDFKKELFEEVNKNIDKGELKAEKDRRKKEPGKQQTQPSTSGERKKKKKKKN
ncbi:uncharacterized protein LOC133183065 isoform X2 [Saccostrea echinata]|uniref:uncharacterized protein LOC133183065 isoform X2 n=1 Tax=Saccostrea echinata TaxID=191078 RepID=UPI002A7EB0A9|nr:uncharacterized protein LOC133183065 isoform X2 [Saccostrea echinata]